MANQLQLQQEQQGQKSQEKEMMTFDALSYIDKDYDDPRVKEVVHTLIEEEMAAFEPPDYLADKPMPKMRFQSPLLKAEWTRVRSGRTMEPMDASRYDLQPPRGTAVEDEGSWKCALDNARAQTEHQHNRYGVNSRVLNNLELFKLLMVECSDGCPYCRSYTLLLWHLGQILVTFVSKGHKRFYKCKYPASVVLKLE